MTTLIKRKNIITDDDDMLEEIPSKPIEEKPEDQIKQKDEKKTDPNQSVPKRKTALLSNESIEQKLKQIKNDMIKQKEQNNNHSQPKKHIQNSNSKSTPNKAKSPMKQHNKMLLNKRKRSKDSSLSSFSSDSDDERYISHSIT